MSSDPLTNMMSAAASMHELKVTLEQQGFTNAEALTILIGLAKPDQYCSNCGGKLEWDS